MELALLFETTPPGHRTVNKTKHVIDPSSYLEGIVGDKTWLKRSREEPSLDERTVQINIMRFVDAKLWNTLLKVSHNFS